MVKIVYAVLSILIVVLVIVFGVGSKSNYFPTSEEEDQLGDKKNDRDKRAKGGKSDASTN